MFLIKVNIFLDLLDNRDIQTNGSLNTIEFNDKNPIESINNNYIYNELIVKCFTYFNALSIDWKDIKLKKCLYFVSI